MTHTHTHTDTLRHSHANTLTAQSWPRPKGLRAQAKGGHSPQSGQMEGVCVCVCVCVSLCVSVCVFVCQREEGQCEKWVEMGLLRECWGASAALWFRAFEGAEVDVSCSWHTLLQLCMCVFYHIFSLCFHGLYTRPLWEYAGCCWPVKGLLKSLECEGRRDWYSWNKHHTVPEVSFPCCSSCMLLHATPQCLFMNNNTTI